MAAQNHTEPVMGMWSAYIELTQQDKELFEKTMKSFAGVTYRPVLVSTQVTNGTNYHFKCIACKLPFTWETLIKIHKPVNGKPQIISIIKL